MHFKKTYIEINNSCNFNCSFCFESGRKKRILSVDEFSLIAKEVKPFCDYIYLHVLGEPLTHPQFTKIVEIATANVLHVNISSNGSLLQKHKDFLLKNSVRQINISLHDAEENILTENWHNYVRQMLEIAKELSANTYINLRLWNQCNESSVGFNHLCYELIQNYFNSPLPTDVFTGKVKSFTLAPNVYLQLAPRFEWTQEKLSVKKKCYGLRDQIAVLSDGSVVPCCIDADANLILGNIFKEKLSDILQSDRAVRIRQGFEQGKAVEPWCQKCGFRI